MTNMHNQNQSLISALIDTTRELTAIIRQEMTLLKEKRPAEIKSLNDSKNSLLASYQEKLDQLNRNGGFKAAGAGEIVRRFKKEHEVFQGVLKQHKSMLYALKTVSEKMIKVIGDEVALQSSPSQSYGANAKINSPKGSKTPTTLTLNKTI